MNQAPCTFSRDLGNHLAREEAQDRKNEAIDAIADEIEGDLETFGEFSEDGITSDMTDLWEPLTEALCAADAPKSIEAARELFEATIKRIRRAEAEALAPQVYAGRCRRWGDA